jgi:uncharacterized membrane protein YqjE
MDETGRLIEAGAHPVPPPRGSPQPVRAPEPARPEQPVRAPRRAAAPPRGGPSEARRAREELRAGDTLSARDPLRRLRTRDLVTELARKASLLARKEVELAKAELKADVRAEIRMASGLGVAGLCGIFTVQLLLVAIVLALTEAEVLPGWAAALLVAAVVLAIGTAVGLWGWARRVRQPLGTTRRSIQEDVRWAKEQIA